MTRLIVLGFGLLLSAAASAAVNLTWGTVEGAQGYKVYVQTPSVTGPAQSFAITAPPFDVGPHLQVGIESEMWMTSTVATPAPYESGQSNHIRYTPPPPPIVTTIPGPPPSVTITWQ